MGTFQRFKAWWITDCPDDVARATARGSRPVPDPEISDAIARFLRRDLEACEARLGEMARRAEHYRSGWRMQAPFIEYRQELAKLAHPAASQPSNAPSA